MRHFDKEIEHLKELLLRMGAMVEDQINESIRALLERDTSLAQRVIEGDTAIDQMELEIDQHTIEMIAMMRRKSLQPRLVNVSPAILPIMIGPPMVFAETSPNKSFFNPTTVITVLSVVSATPI